LWWLSWQGGILISFLKSGTVAGHNDKSKKNELTYIAETIAITGADDQNRTGDLLITNQLLYRLSYIGIH
jgi:hypothetical protein